MRLLADLHISPRTIAFLRSLGHDAIRADALLPANAPDLELVEAALKEGRTVLTQDLDFSAIIALTGRRAPSIITLRLFSSRVEARDAVPLRYSTCVRRGKNISGERSPPRKTDARERMSSPSKITVPINRACSVPTLAKGVTSPKTAETIDSPVKIRNGPRSLSFQSFAHFEAH